MLYNVRKCEHLFYKPGRQYIEQEEKSRKLET